MAARLQHTRHALLAREDAAHTAPVPTQTNRSDVTQADAVAMPKFMARLSPPLACLQACAIAAGRHIHTERRATSPYHAMPCPALRVTVV